MQSMLIKQAFIKKYNGMYAMCFLKEHCPFNQNRFLCNKDMISRQNVTCTGIGRLNHHLPSNLTFSTN